MIDFLLRIFVSPEDILGLLLDLLNIVALCFVFHEIGVKWWKSLIPIYSTYLSYRHFWKHRWFCLLEFALLFLDSRCTATIRKNLLVDAYEFFDALIETQTLVVDVNVPLLVTCIWGSILAATAVFVMKRMTCYKMGKRLEYGGWKLVAGIVSPIFIFAFILYDRHKKKKETKEVAQ